MCVLLRAIDFHTAGPERGVVLRRRNECSVIAYDHRLTQLQAIAKALRLEYLTVEEIEWLARQAATILAPLPTARATAVDPRVAVCVVSHVLCDTTNRRQGDQQRVEPRVRGVVRQAPRRCAPDLRE